MKVARLLRTPMFVGAVVLTPVGLPRAGAVSADAGVPADAAAAVDVGAGAAVEREEARVRESFVVEPFVNVKATRALDHLRLGAPALIAERLGRYAPLRFVGAPDLVMRAQPGANWVVTGSFERLADWRVAITVEIRTGSASGDVAARARREAGKDQASKAVVEAAAAAFADLPGIKLATPSAVVLAPFGRDPYAFVLYGRALSAHQGKGGAAVRSERAQALLKRVLLIDPKVPEARRLAGVLHLQAGKPGHARGMWSLALEERPTYIAALSALAALDRTAGLPSARERYARLLQLDPEDLEARRVYGEILSETGDLVGAQTELERVIRAAPGDLRARRALALVLAARRAGKELAAELEQLVKLDPENAEARMDLGAAYMSIGMNEEAASTYEEVLRRRPRHAGALKLAADLARGRGDLKKAGAYYLKLRFLSPQDPRPVFLMAAAHYDAGNLGMAKRYFNDAAHYPGMLGDAYANLGAVAMQRGDVKQALWYLSRAVKKRPDKAGIRFNHALALHKLGRSADALNELKVAESVDPRDAGVRFLAGVVCLRLGLLHDAEEAFKEALRLDPKYEDARHNLALLESVISPKGEGSLSLINADEGAVRSARSAPPPRPDDASASTP